MGILQPLSLEPFIVARACGPPPARLPEAISASPEDFPQPFRLLTIPFQLVAKQSFCVFVSLAIFPFLFTCDCLEKQFYHLAE